VSNKEIGILALKIIALTLVLMLVNAMGSRFLPAIEEAGAGAEAMEGPQQASQPSGSFLALVLSVMFLQTLALAYPVVRSRWHGWRLIVTVFVVYFGTVTFMSQIESLVYLNDRLSSGMLAGLFAMGLFNAMVFAPIIVAVLSKWKAAPPTEADSRRVPPRTPMDWLWRLLFAGGVFLAFYYVFGYFVAWKNPVLRDYYGGTDPGTFLAQMSGILRDSPWMIPLQFVRGLLWVALALPVIRMMKGPWWEAGVALAILFSVPVIYLLFPNPFMPDAVRMTHLVETAPYQFLFGWLVAWIFRRGHLGRREPSLATVG
jgi:hypothetical protein